MSTATQSDMRIPPNPPLVGQTFPGDEIEEIGDQIAALTPQEARILNGYLKYFYGITVQVKS